MMASRIVSRLFPRPSFRRVRSGASPSGVSARRSSWRRSRSGSAGCSNTTTDAATITYRDATGSHTTHISRSDFQGELDDLLANDKFVQLLKSGGNFPNVDATGSTDTRLATIWLTQLIDQVAVDAEVQRAHLTVTAADTANGKTLQEQTFSAAAFGAFSKSFAAKLVDRGARLAALGRYYETCPSGRFVSHILLKTQAEADAALKLIQAGQKFADVAKLRSTDTGSAPQGGALGCLTPNEFVSEFQDAAATAPLGVVTAPVKTQFGYHLILVRRWDPVADKSFATSLSQAAGAAYTALLQTFHVWISPRYGTWGKQTDPQSGSTVLGVSPPAVPAVRTCREKSAACAPATSTTTTVPAGG